MSDPAIVFAFIAISGAVLMVGIWIGKVFYGGAFYREGFRHGRQAVANDYASRIQVPRIRISPRAFRNGITRNN